MSSEVLCVAGQDSNACLSRWQWPLLCVVGCRASLCGPGLHEPPRRGALPNLAGPSRGIGALSAGARLEFEVRLGLACASSLLCVCAAASLLVCACLRLSALVCALACLRACTAARLRVCEFTRRRAHDRRDCR